MSSPSGKRFDPFDLSPYAPKRARENVERTPVESGVDDPSEDAAAPAYVPRAAMRPAAAQEHPIDPDAGDRTPPGPTRAAKRSRTIPPATPSWRGSNRACGGCNARVRSKGFRAPFSCRRCWLPRFDPQARPEQFIDGVRVPPSLASGRVRPPPLRARRDNLRGPLRVLVASVIAAPIAYYFSVGNLAPGPEPAGASGLASLAPRWVAGSEFSIPKEKLRPGEAADDDSAVSSRNKSLAQPTAAGESALSARAEAAAIPPPIPAPAPAAPAGRTVRELDPDSVKLLMQQGGQFVASGDLVAARLVYQRAAESGTAAAALALGATFDPTVLAKIGVRGMGSDIEKARGWYEKAKELGSPEAPRRLELLANR
jgi:hypothetical protein